MMDLGRILVVDDEAPVREVLTEYFSTEGYAVEAATSGVEALIAVRGGRADLVLLDVRMPGLDADGLRAVADTLRNRLGSGIVCVGSVVDGKVNLIAAVTKDLTSRFQAGRLIQEVAKAVGGGGGGRPDLAQAGGKDPAKLDAALELAYEFVARAGA